MRLFRNPILSLLVVLLLGLGIAAVSAVASLADGLLLRPARYPDAAALAVIHRTGPGFRTGQFHPTAALELQERLAPVADLAAFAPGQSVRLEEGGSHPVARVTGSFFQVLQIRPFLGRLGFTPEEDRTGGEPVVVLSFEAWRTVGHGDPAMVGRTLRLDNVSYRVVGVLPQGFRPPTCRIEHPSLYVPAAWTAPERARRENNWEVAARVRHGRADLDGALERIQREGWAWSQGLRSGGFAETLGAPWRGTLVLFGSSALLILVLACVNATHLLLALAAERRAEWALRAALGARRLDLFKVSIGPASLLAGAGLAVGLLGAGPLARGLALQLGLRDLPVMGLWPMVAGAAAALAGALVAGLVPAFSTFSVQAGEVLKELPHGGRRAGRHLVVVAELALACTLLVGAFHLLQGLQARAKARPGFEPRNLLVMRIQLPTGAFPEPAARLAAFRALQDRLAQLPGVQGALVTQTSPLVAPPGHGMSFAGQTVKVWHHRALGDLTGTLGLPLVAGRVPLPGEAGCVISEPLARQVFPDRSPLGQMVSLGADPMPVTGVVGGTPEEDLRQGPVAQAWWSLDPEWTFAEVYLRTTAAPSALREPVASACRAVVPGMTPRPLRRVQEVLDQGGQTERQGALLLGTLATVAGLLSVIGLAGILGQLVAQRRREIGIRMALGAPSRSILALVFRQGFRLAAWGASLGLLGAVALVQVLRSQMDGLGHLDPAGAVLPMVLLLSAALLASLVPALKACSLPPSTALKGDGA